MICATSLQGKRSKSLASLGDEPGVTKQWWTTLVHCMKHEKIFEQVYKLMTAALHGNGTLAVVCCVTRRSALAASEESELESSGGTSPGSCTSLSLFLVNV
jgi:hypothetical protein